MDLGQIVIIGGGIVALIVFIAILSFVPLGLWITAKTAGAGIAMMQLVAMRLRKVPPPLIVNARINALKAGLNVTTNQLEAHYLARGHVDLVIQALISAGQGRHRPRLRSRGGHRPGRPARARSGADERQPARHHHAEDPRRGQGRDPAAGGRPHHRAHQPGSHRRRRRRGDDPRARRRRRGVHDRRGPRLQAGAGEPGFDLQDRAQQGARRGHRVRDPVDRHRRRRGRLERRRQAAGRAGRGVEAGVAGAGGKPSRQRSGAGAGDEGARAGDARQAGRGRGAGADRDGRGACARGAWASWTTIR